MIAPRFFQCDGASAANGVKKRTATAFSAVGGRLLRFHFIGMVHTQNEKDIPSATPLPSLRLRAPVANSQAQNVLRSEIARARP